ncbi:lipocalin-like domain-containing protein [Mycolicibacter arupensis]|uniref:lipocalin-like domain-containing protein n=1 Tax=Mycolicibacter arupensis TaxID=342002 RepID=UPI0009F434E0|nr:lipocalin-like domain-containing protein [Mycolicibacter arupensis]MCV7274568.1 lipocalin-like domain-containing protein [Mycolicibacter arupensis]
MPNTSDRPEGLREALLGGWELSSFDSVDIDTGAVSHPLGTAPRGLILYTADGYMSAQLADGSDAAVQDTGRSPIVGPLCSRAVCD